MWSVADCNFELSCLKCGTVVGPERVCMIQQEYVCVCYDEKKVLEQRVRVLGCVRFSVADKSMHHGAILVFIL